MTEKLLTDVEYNYKFIDERIAEAAEKSGRKREDITFLAACIDLAFAFILNVNTTKLFSS